MPVLQKRYQVRRLQRFGNAAEAFDQSRQDILAQAQRQLCRLPEEGQKGYQAGAVYGAIAVLYVGMAS
jgi:hypothetical protein